MDDFEIMDFNIMGMKEGFPISSFPRRQQLDRFGCS
jgi:hypothetical protein